MKTRKSNLRMAFTSIISLLLCVSMLVGTTFAWFTDSVTSGMNIIATGNLDVELDYWNGTQWKTVEAASDILTGDNWEPGYTDVAYLRIRNVGDLALNYQFGVNIRSEDPGTNMAGEEFLLSDYIYFDVSDVNGETNSYASREDAMKIATNTAKISDSYSKPGTLAPGSDYEYVALVVYMPTTVGNKANNNGSDVPEINLGIQVTATQVPHEYDSFGKDYDSGATNQLPEIPLSKGGKVSGAAPEINNTKKYEVTNTDNIPIGSVEISGDSVETSTTNIIIEIIPDEPNANVTTSTNQKKETFDISVNGIKADNNADITVTLNYRPGLAGVQVFHYDKEIEDVNYDATTGIITFTTKSFSPYTIVHTVETDNEDDGNEESNEVDSEEALIAAVAKGGTAKVSRNISLNSTLAINKSVTLDLNGYSIACGTQNAYIQITGDGELTVTDSGSTGSISGFTTDQGIIQAGVINNGTVTVGSGAVKGGILNHGGTVIVNNGVITSDFTGISTDGGSVTVNGGSVSGSRGGIQIDPYESKNAATVTITGGTVNGGITTYFYENAQYGPINISGGTINGGVMNNGTLNITGGTINDGVNNHGGTVIVENGTIQSNFTGIYSDSGSITVRGGTIHGNNQGICNDYNKRDAKSSVVTINGGSVTCNEPSEDGTGPVRVGIMNYGYSEVYVSAGYVTSFGVTNNEMNPYHGIISVTGGTFQQDPSSYLAEGYQAVLNGSNLYEVAKGNDNTGEGGIYSVDSEEALLAAFAKGGTVKLSGNITVSGQVWNQNPVTLDLNGYTITCKTQGQLQPGQPVQPGQIIAANEMIIIDSGSTGSIVGATMPNGSIGQCVNNNNALTIKGGTFHGGIMNYGTLTVDGGVITTASYGIMSSGGNVTVNGGSVEGYYAGIRNDYFEPIQTGIVTVNGGSVTSSNGVGILNYGNREVYVTGGYVGSLGTVSTDQASYTGIVSVTGGTFQQDPSGFLAEGYKAEQNSQHLYVVTKA